MTNPKTFEELLKDYPRPEGNRKEKTITTGFIQIDTLLHYAGVVPLPFALEFFGIPGSGKSTVSMFILKHLYKYHGLQGVYHETESKLDERAAKLTGFWQETELNPENKMPQRIKITGDRGMYGEDFINFMGNIYLLGNNNAFVVDTISSMSYKAESEAEVETNFIGKRAIFEGRMALRCQSCWRRNPDNFLLLVSQARDVFGNNTFYDMKKPTTGNAIKHFVKASLQFSRPAQAEKTVKVGGIPRTASLKIRVKTHKSSLASKSEAIIILPFYPEELIQYTIEYNILKLAESLGMVKNVNYKKHLIAGEQKILLGANMLEACESLYKLKKEDFMLMYESIGKEWVKKITIPENKIERI